MNTLPFLTTSEKREMLLQKGKYFFRKMIGGVVCEDRESLSNQLEGLNKMDVFTQSFGTSTLGANALQQDAFMSFGDSSEIDNLSFSLQDAPSADVPLYLEHTAVGPMSYWCAIRNQLKCFPRWLLKCLLFLRLVTVVIYISFMVADLSLLYKLDLVKTISLN